MPGGLPQKYVGTIKERKAAALRAHRKLHPEKWKEWRRVDREKHKDKYIEAEFRRRLKNDFGLTIEDYNKLLDKQHGCCAICLQPETAKNTRGEIKKLAVDHNHASRKVRALLCANCNTGLGLLGESPDRMRAAALYIERHNGNS